jgi:tetratricopeptide (TPR) repeat protein
MPASRASHDGLRGDKAKATAGSLRRLLVICLTGCIFSASVLAIRVWLNRVDAPDSAIVMQDEAFVVELAFLPEATVEDYKDAALAEAEELANRYPANPKALDILARVHYSLRHLDEAAALWQRALQVDSNFPAALYGLGYQAAEREDFEEAVELYGRALAAAPGDPRIAPQLGDTLVKLGRGDQAVRVLEQYVREHPTSSSTAVVLGQAYLQQREYEKAKAVFEATLAFDSSEKDLYYGLMRACTSLGQRDQALEAMAKFRELAKSELGQSSRKIQQTVDAESTREITLRTFTEAADVYFEGGDVERAEDLWRKAAFLDPRDTRCRRGLLALYERTNREGRALRVCQQLQQLQPENLDHWLNAGMLRARLGQFDAARHDLEHALRGDPGNQRYQQAYELVEGQD